MRFVVVCVLAFVAVAVANDVEVQTAFREFTVTYGKKYASVEAEQKAFATFWANLQVMELHRRANPHATFGVTQFSDMTPEEFAATLNGSPKLQSQAVAPAASPLSEAHCDWRARGGVTPVKNQGNCGSAVAHSVAAQMEGVHFAANSKLVPLSEKQLECATGCAGATQPQVYNYIMKTLHGKMATAASYQTCNQSNWAIGCVMTSFWQLPQIESTMSDVLCKNGPLSVGVAGTQWQFYRGGILTNCGATTINHAATVVGVDDTVAVPYWLVKNSWGTAWGENGYIRIAKGKNVCGITLSAYTGFVTK